ncbi:ribonuclease H-like domain-containing protein [Tanacetum coccineum]
MAQTSGSSRRQCKHAKLPFYNSESSVNSVFEIIHSDIWTSPILSENGIKYYAIFLDHFSHFVWVYPLYKKFDLFDNFVVFRAYVNKQFNVDIKALQCDHGGEYDNTRFHDLFRQNGIQFRFSCPRTSQQNGKSERMLRTINNLIRTLLFQAHIPPSYWVEALNMAAHLLNILPSTTINNEIPFTKLYNQTPTYEHLRVFGCLCYPHVDVSHKLEPRSTPCIFLGYPANHRGYRCLDLASNKIIISRHVRFDEDVFPFGNVTSSNKPTYDFLLPPIQTTTNVPTIEPFVQHMDEPNNPITPHPTTPPTSPPQPDTPQSHNSTPIPPQHDTHPSHSSTPIPTSAQTQSHAQTVDSHTPIPINNSSETMPTIPWSLGLKLSFLNCLNVCLYMHDPRDPHFTALKRILRYVRGTLDYGMQLHVSSTTQLSAYTDTDWAGCPVTRRSTSGYCVFLGDNLLSWSAKSQVTLSRSSAEAEYRCVANVVAETAWIRNLLCELHTPLFTATLVYCENVSAVYMSANPVQHQRTKHIEIDIYFVRDFVASGQVCVLHVPSRFQYANIFTKGLPTALFIEFRSSLNVRRSPAYTEREY